MITGFILDAYPDYHTNTMVTWVTHNDTPTRITEPYTPSFYVHAPLAKRTDLLHTIQQLPQIKQARLTTAKTQLGSDHITPVIEIKPTRLNDLRRLATTIDAWGGFHRYHLYNVDLRLPTRYLHTKGVFCNAYITHKTPHQFILHDDQWAIDYHQPALTSIQLRVNPTEQRPLRFNHPITGFTIDDSFIFEDNEIDTILTTIAYLHKKDPDIIYTRNGDGILFPYVYHRARTLGISSQITFGRDIINPTTLGPQKQAKSYFSYGRIIYRPAFYTLQGRIHLDMANSFLYGESGLRGLLDISRCANIPLQLTSRLGPGTAISQIQVNTAQTQGYLIPWKKNIPETWKTAEDLLIADRGGIFLEPRPGLYENVLELDYASLYPNIMLRHNISPETLLCSCCPDSPHRVPQLHYHICSCHKGLIPQVLQPILHRRFAFKARAKNPRYDTRIYQELQHAWKWVLLVCFGYTGYRNARYGRIECHESITAYSRDVLLTAMELANQADYTVIHGIIDSLWLQQNQSPISPIHLTRCIGDHTGIRMDVEARYRWIVFLPSKQTGVGALTRYYGVFTNDILKVRGVELRQRNTPPYLKKMQKQMLTTLATAHTTIQFYHQIPKVLAIAQYHAHQLHSNQVSPYDLVYTTSIARDITDYEVNTIPKAALLQLRDMNLTPQRGQHIRYLVTNAETSDYTKRVCVAEKLNKNTHIDTHHYCRQIARLTESILIPFGYKKEPLEEMLYGNTITPHNANTLLP
jgi:DNA polymerase elongation subunit (family B)